MDELEREDMMRDAYYDATHSRYEVKVTVEFTYRTTAKTRGEAVDIACEDIAEALRGSYLDYDYVEFDTEKVDD